MLSSRALWKNFLTDPRARRPEKCTRACLNNEIICTSVEAVSPGDLPGPAHCPSPGDGEVVSRGATADCGRGTSRKRRTCERAPVHSAVNDTLNNRRGRNCCESLGCKSDGNTEAVRRERAVNGHARRHGDGAR
ncbi:hypothetical protein SKAU_G00256250 [Synaphobranchus kaupii]|uniref:Uncharacterized protein n=1 Tax=Synaphobranchus kaupii TaxID=118154 RepID=A0A9Q1ISC7_SYNKA|nr:hypothetical protein SKAU_G00256250 [Synaphobranchus kaupii]